MRQLPLFFNIAGRPVLLVGEGPMAEAKTRLIESAGGTVVREAGEARLAFVTGEDAEAVAAALRSQGLLVNVVDRPELCDFTVPAIVDRDPVTVAIGTAGSSATLAKALRERLEVLMPASLGTLAEALHRARASLASRFPEMADRRRFLDRLLAPGGALDPLADAQDVETAIEEGALPDAPPAVVIIAREPDALTLAELRALSTADTVFHTEDAAQSVLDRARRDAERVAAPRLPEELPPGRTVFLASSPPPAGPDWPASWSRPGRRQPRHW